MRRQLYVFLLAALALATLGPERAYPQDALASLRAQLERIEAISGHFMALIDARSPQEGAIRASGKTLFYEYDWKYDRFHGLQLFDGKLGLVQANTWKYEPQVFAWDGEDYVAYKPELKRALKSGDPWLGLAANKSPAVLIGDNLLSRFSVGLIDVLDHGVNVVVNDNTIQAEFDFALRGNEPTSKVLVEIDPRYDFLPRQIVISDLASSRKFVEIRVQAFSRDSGTGMYFPVEGHIENFQWVRSSIDPEKYVPRSLGVGKIHLSLDPSSLRINPEISKSDFSVDLPEEVAWFDERTGESYQSTGFASKPLPSISGYLLAFLILGVVIALVYLWRKK
jgi:hypothetical protein